MSVMYIRIRNPKFLEQDAYGRPAVGYLVWTLVAGSVDTLVTTYSNKELTAAHTNPIVLDMYGEADIFTNQALKLVYTLPGGDLTSPIWTEDYVNGQQGATTFLADGATSDGHNNYSACLTPIVTALFDQMQVIITPDADSKDTLGSTVHTGPGINDGMFSGPYVGTTPGSVFTVVIDTTGTTDTFKWRKDGGGWTQYIQITGALQPLIEGVGISFSVVSGHTLGDTWTVTVETPARFNFCNLGNKLIYKNVGGTLTALGAGDLKEDVPITLLYSSIQDCYILPGPALPVLSTLIPLRVRKDIYSSTYTISLSDQGRELAFHSACTIYFPLCSTIPHIFVWLRVIGIYNCTLNIQPGAPSLERIYKPYDSVGTTSYNFPSGCAIQIQCNGVDIHIIAETQPPRGRVLFTPAQSWQYWTCPDGVFSADITMISGGGGGAFSSSGFYAGGGGSGGFIRMMATVIPKGAYLLVIGSGGAAGVGNGDGGDGGYTAISSLGTVNGGKGGLSSFIHPTGPWGGAAGNFAGQDGTDGDGPGFIPGDGGKCIPAYTWGNYAAGGDGGLYSGRGSTAGGDGLIVIEF